ncbi:MAG TPA: protein kinase [Gemmatimonadaceae bacterium]|nr:protein kinase [Gemmatimonadaceae bacterium]
MTSKPRTPTALKGEYEILRELGRGGTSVVYLAREIATGDEVAIKQIRAKYIEDEEAVARFAREARFVAQLAHPNIIPVRRVLDLKRGGVALVMDHVPGRTLRDLIREAGPLPPERAEQIMRDVAAALGVAHGMGIVHRDVKPENIFVDNSGRAMLADFGLARAMDGDLQLTMAGVAIGTPAYMAPEQIDGNDLDARGDIYSLGLVAWEMLTGKRPWEGETLYAILYRQKYEQLPDVRAMRPDVPDRLADAIAVAIEKNRDSRWQDVNALVAALDHGAGTVERRLAPRTPVSTETLRFERPGAPAASAPPMVAAVTALTPVTPSTARAALPSEMPIAEALASVAAELAADRHDATGGSRRRSVMIFGGLATVAAVALIAAATQHWFKPQAPPPRMIVQASSPGNVESSAQPSPLASHTDSVKAIGPSVAVASPSSEPSAPLQLTPAEESPLREGAATPDSSDAGRQTVAKGATQQATPAATSKTASPPAPPPQSPAPSVTSAPAPLSRPAVTVAGARATVIAGGMHTCFVGAEGKVFCWGANDRGQLGNGGTTRSASPSVVAIDLRFTTMAAGLSHNCAIARGGSAWCWGANDHGQLGDRTTAQHSMPARVSGNRSFTAITVGAAHSCALDDAGGVWCWGSNEQGQLGAFGGEGTAESGTPLAVAWRGRFAMVAAGWNFTCALEVSGRAMCWGDGGSGQLGDGSTSDRRAPGWVNGDRTFTSIAAGSAHACGVTPEGDVYCWGRNNGGQLGDGSRVDHATPVRVKSSEHFVAVAAGAVHTCALTAAGEAFCWGRNNYGQLGDGGAGDQTVPVAVTGGHTFASLRAFGSHTCGTTTSGEAFCWGYNLEGQLGDGTRIHRTRPVYVEPPGGG